MRFVFVILAGLYVGCGRPDAPDSLTQPSSNVAPSLPPDADGVNGQAEAPTDIEVICTDVAYSGIGVTVRDAETGAYIREGVQGFASEEAYVDTLTFYGQFRTAPDAPSAAVLTGVFERPGIYTVTVRHPDYHAWQRDTVRVAADDCHVIPRSLDAMLTPISS